MANLIKKTAVKDATDKNVGMDFYKALDDRVMELINKASERAESNGRKTVKARDA